ncbi:MAG: GNAT family N-acetyltransferase [Cyanobacteria bacterium P01_D01_bin.44]
MSHHKLALRPAISADADAVKALTCRVFEKYIEQIGRIPRPMLADYELVIANEHVWVVEENNQLVAVLVLAIRENHYHINSIAVRPDKQRQGLGKALLSHAEDQSIQAGYCEIWLHTNETMTHNIRLYTSVGYKEMYRQTKQGTDSLYMKKELGGHLPRPIPQDDCRK